MTHWNYYNENGEKISVTGKEFKELALTGKITRGTFIESPEGRTGLAKDVKGLKFADTVQPKTASNTFTVEDQAEIDQFCAEYGTDVKATVKGNTNNSLLHEAATSGKIAVVRFLVSKGADVGMKNKIGTTPLHWADNVEVAKFLVFNGADVSAKTDGGNTPLHFARNAEIAEFFFSKGLDVHAKDNDNGTPLHWAKNAEVAEFLISKGADINAKNNKGETPLHRTTRLHLVNRLRLLPPN